MRRLVAIFIVSLFSFLIFATAPTRAGTCDDAKIPAEGENNLWYCWNDSDTAVVFVHGLHSSSRTAWMGEKTPASFWPKLVLTDPALKEPSIFLGGFYTDTDSTTFGMHEASGSLFSKLSSSVSGHPPVLAKKNILFVAHSLGGILTRDVLTRYKAQFAGKRIGLLLVASPSSGADLMSYINHTANAVAMSKMISELATGSRYLQLLDDDFKSLIKDRTLSLDGREIFEQYVVKTGTTSWLPTFVTRRIEPLVPMDKTVKYFGDPQLIAGSDHITIAKPDTLEHLSHQKLVKVYSLMFEAPEPSCEAPPDFEIALDVMTSDPERGLNPSWSPAAKAVLPQYKFVRHFEDHDEVVKRPVPRDSESGRYFYKPRGAFPCRGEKFSATFRRVPPESTMSAADTSTGLCFTRSTAKPNDKGAGFGCAEGQACSIAPQEAGLAEPCPKAQQGWQIPRLISSAYAAPAQAEPMPTASTHWEVPSLETMKDMPDEIRSGYAEFTLTSPARKDLTDATTFSTGLSVNGVTLYVDSLPPHAEHVAFTPSEGLKHAFALENLGFTGGTTGYETITVEIKYWHGQTLLATDVISRNDYISYRHAPALSVKNTKSGGTYMWSGYYRPSKAQTAYEVILAVDPKPDAMIKTKGDFDKASKVYNGAPVIGVIRPGRKENKIYGMTFGIKLPTGQVKSLFSEQEAKGICRWVLAEKGVPEWMRKGANLYSFPASFFTENKDRGQYGGACTKA